MNRRPVCLRPHKVKIVIFTEDARRKVTDIIWHDTVQSPESEQVDVDWFILPWWKELKQVKKTLD